MPVATTRTKYPSNEVKPWERLGMSYQKYNYQKKKGLITESGNPTITQIIPPTNAQVDHDTLIRNSTLLDTFLELCEWNAAADRGGLFFTQQMCNAIYQTLRNDGH